MPAIILTNQIYRPGETPVFAAYLYDSAGEALKRNQIASITMTHMERREGLQGIMIVETWYPVEYPDGILEDVSVSVKTVYDNVITIDNNDFLAFDRRPLRIPSVKRPDLTQYNFIYIPLRGRQFYPSEGLYQTVFKIELKDPATDTHAGTDILTFESEASLFTDDDMELPTLIQNIQNNIIHGHNIDFTLNIYAKYKELNGDLWLMDNPTLIDYTDEDDPVPIEFRNLLHEIYLTVFDNRSSVNLTGRIPIKNAVTITPVLIGGEKAFRIDYQFQTNQLPMSGNYRFRFEIETIPVNIDRDTNILCVVDADVWVG